MHQNIYIFPFINQRIWYNWSLVGWFIHSVLMWPKSNLTHHQQPLFLALVLIRCLTNPDWLSSGFHTCRDRVVQSKKKLQEKSFFLQLSRARPSVLCISWLCVTPVSFFQPRLSFSSLQLLLNCCYPESFFPLVSQWSGTQQPAALGRVSCPFC